MVALRKTKILAFLVYFFLLWPLAADYEALFYALLDDLYNQETVSADIHQEAIRGVELVRKEGLTRSDALFWEARFEYIRGRAYMYEDVGTKERVDKFKSQNAEKSLERAYDLLGEALELEERSDFLVLRAESLGQLCVLRGLIFAATNGPEVRRMTKRALEIDPENVKGRILQANDRLYTPKLFGGNPREGLTLFTKLVEREDLERDDLFNIYSGIGVGWSMEKNDEKAEEWLSKALEVYPGNIYLKRILGIWEMP